MTEEPKTAIVASSLAGNIHSAYRDVLEAREELRANPSYNAAIKVQILERHWQKLRELRVV